MSRRTEQAVRRQCWTRRIVTLAASVATCAVVVMTMTASTVPASAAPYSNPPTVGASTQNPAIGGSVVLSGQGFGANEAVSDTLHSAPIALTGTRTDTEGSFQVTVTLPAGITGAHTIVSTGMTSGRTATLAIFIGPGSGAGGAGTGIGAAGGLSDTGVAIVGIAGLGVVLLLGGGVMLVSGKRRRVRS